jgi:hypothetical protein
MALDPAPNNLRKKTSYQFGHGDLAVYRSIRFGVPETGMAPWEGRLSDRQIGSITRYVRSMQQTTSSDLAALPAQVPQLLMKIFNEPPFIDIRDWQEGWIRGTGSTSMVLRFSAPNRYSLRGPHACEEAGKVSLVETNERNFRVTFTDRRVPDFSFSNASEMPLWWLKNEVHHCQ